MRRTISILGATLVGVLPLVAFPPATSADVAISQQVVMIRDSGPHQVRYREGTPYQAGYLGTTYNFSKGTLTYSLKVYRLKERVRKYDYYLLDVTAQTSRRSGYDGRATLRLGTDREVNHTNYTSTVRDSPSDCKTFPVTVGGTVWPNVSVGTTVGHVRTCGKDFSMSRVSSSTTGAYVVKRLNRARQVTTQKWIRVAAGKKPPFRFQLSYGYDTCAARGEYMGTSFCTKVKRATRSTTRYTVPTRR